MNISGLRLEVICGIQRNLHRAETVKGNGIFILSMMVTMVAMRKGLVTAIVVGTLGSLANAGRVSGIRSNALLDKTN